MVPSIPIFRSSTLLVYRSRITSSSSSQIPICLRIASRRSITANEKPLPKAGGSSHSPNQEQAPHVSEEAAELAEVVGETAPDIGQGTPVQEILKRDGGGQDKAPEVLKQDIKSSTNGSRSFSTLARRPAQEAMISFEDTGLETDGHKFGLPELPLKSGAHLKYRYDPVIKQVTNLLMEDGKLSVAQRNMATILNHLRTASPPSVNPQHPLLPDAPPASHLPLNPVLYLTIAIDSVAPLLRIRSQRGAAGGGVALQIPVPLGLRQRRRQAVVWILNAASKRRSIDSGRGTFARKVAEELIAIVEGRSSIWDKRGGVHKLAVAARANLNRRGRR